MVTANLPQLSSFSLLLLNINMAKATVKRTASPLPTEQAKTKNAKIVKSKEAGVPLEALTENDLLKISEDRMKDFYSSVQDYKIENSSISTLILLLGLPKKPKLSQVADLFPAAQRITIKDDNLVPHKLAHIVFQNRSDTVTAFKETLNWPKIDGQRLTVVFGSPATQHKKSSKRNKDKQLPKNNVRRSKTKRMPRHQK